MMLMILGDTLKKLESKWIESGFTLEKQKLLASLG